MSAKETILKDGWMTQRQVQQRLKIGVVAIHALNQSGKLPGYIESKEEPGVFIKKTISGDMAKGQRVFYKEEDITAYEKQRTHLPRPALPISQQDREKYIELGKQMLQQRGYVRRIALLEQLNRSTYEGKSRPFFNNHFFGTFTAIADGQNWPQPPRGRHAIKEENE